MHKLRPSLLCKLTKIKAENLRLATRITKKSGKAGERREGEEIPEMARIIAVADSYDAMTSKRSYRDPIPQHQVREELVKGAGTQFDPMYANLMLGLLDIDTEYEMKEREDIRDLAKKNELNIGEYRSAVSEGIALNQLMTTITMKSATLIRRRRSQSK